ncbi:MAG TPA: diaminopimelate epimerase [Planctomycetaceae bacterium]|nr:diaminopimelate epimerase [Planctomycetaceae bacterium]
MRFTKMHGAGNDYIYVNCFEEPVPENPEELARRISDRHFGVGGDGLVLVLPGSDADSKADARMRMFNADGSESEMCGNAIRCVGKLVYDRGIARKDHVSIETGRGVLPLQLFIKDGRVAGARVDMGRPILDPALVPTTLRAQAGNPPDAPVIDVPFTIGGKTVKTAKTATPFPVSCVSMGNPHCVVFVDKIDDEWVRNVGPMLEAAPEFPRRVNAEFVEVRSPVELRMRVWERGSGETLACGTGACAVVVAGALSGRVARKASVRLNGGILDIEWSEANDHVFLSGEAVEVFQGTFFP